jgi:hypothetical protein
MHTESPAKRSRRFSGRGGHANEHIAGYRAETCRQKKRSCRSDGLFAFSPLHCMPIFNSFGSRMACLCFRFSHARNELVTENGAECAAICPCLKLPDIFILERCSARTVQLALTESTLDVSLGVFLAMSSQAEGNNKQSGTARLS